MKFRLKKNQESFCEVDGIFAGREFIHGKEYTSLPGNKSNRFEKIKKAKTKAVKEVSECDLTEQPTT